MNACAESQLLKALFEAWRKNGVQALPRQEFEISSQIRLNARDLPIGRVVPRARLAPG